MSQNSTGGGQSLNWIITALVVGAAIIGIAKLSNKNKQDAPNADNEIMEILSNDHAIGNSSSAVTLIEYSDFQCPACAYYQPQVEQLYQDFGDKIRIVYRHFPLDQHARAIITAQAAEAAGQQDKFWEMTNLLFNKQAEWIASANIDSMLGTYAQILSLDLVKFTSDMNNPEILAKINKDAASGQELGVSYTPYFVLNGQVIDNPASYEEFKQTILDEIQNS